MCFKVILFDLDGTIANSMPLLKKTFQNVFGDMGIPWDETHMTNLSTLPVKESAKIYAEKRVKEFLTSFMKHYLSEHNKLMEMFPGTRELLELLKSHSFRLGIVTSKTRAGAMACLDFLEITTLMDVIITVDDAANHKPHPDPLIKALELLSASKEETLFIGDSPPDLVAAKSAGIPVAYVTWGAGNNEDALQYKPDYIIENWNQLTDLILTP